MRKKPMDYIDGIPINRYRSKLITEFTSGNMSADQLNRVLEEKIPFATDLFHPRKPSTADMHGHCCLTGIPTATLQ